MAMKCVAQMPQPVVTPAVVSQASRARPLAARARGNRLMAARLVRKQIKTASRTSRQSCSTVRQLKTLNMASSRVRALHACILCGADKQSNISGLAAYQFVEIRMAAVGRMVADHR